VSEVSHFVHRFTGQERDTETGLDFFQARYHGSAQGRFLSPDPAGNFVAELTDPQSWNMFGYVRNNPLSFIDPSGLCSQDSSGNFYDDNDTGDTFLYDGNCNSNDSGLVNGATSTDTVTAQEEDLSYEDSSDDDSLDYTFFVTGYGQNPGQTPGQPGTASLALRRFLQSCEGFRGGAYNDSRNNCTIGFGHLIHLGPCTVTETQMRIGPQVAADLFNQDLESTVQGLNQALSVPTTQGQFDALVSLGYNMGLSRLQTHSIWRDVNAGNSARGPADIRSLSAGGAGIPNRRANEAAIFGSGTYAPACYAHP
jgi:RHS repeat-associated protein